MPAQIKLGNTPDIQTVGAVNAGTAIVPDASNSLFLADGSNRVAATSEFYSGPTQPLGNVKMWFDTTTGQLKVNDGKSWTVQKGHVQAKDHGSFDPGPAVYTGFVQRFRHVASENTSDEVSASVHLTRGSGGWLYNSLQENASDDNTPSGTEWAFAGIDGNPEVISANNYAGLTFNTFPIAANGYSAYHMQYIPGVCHLIAEDIYFDIRIAAWFGCNSNSASDSLIILERSAIPGSSIGEPIPDLITITIEEQLGAAVGELTIYINSTPYSPGTYQLVPGKYGVQVISTNSNDKVYLNVALETDLATSYIPQFPATSSLTLVCPFAENTRLTYGCTR